MIDDETFVEENRWFGEGYRGIGRLQDHHLDVTRGRECLAVAPTAANRGYCSCCCSHITSHNQVRGHRTGSSHSGAEEYPREKHKQSKGGAPIYHS